MFRPKEVRKPSCQNLCLTKESDYFQEISETFPVLKVTTFHLAVFDQ